MTALFDTNILIDYLKALPQARAEIQSYPARAISIVTWMEVMAGTKSTDEPATRGLLDSFVLLALDETIAERALLLLQQQRLKWPDAVIRATAQVHGLVLITRDIRDFPPGDPGVRAPYTL